MDSAGIWVVFLSIVILLCLGFLFTAFWYGSWFSARSQGESPYTGLPLRTATDLSYYAAEKVLRFLFNFHQYDNRVFKLRKAAYCRETGRIFQDCVNFFNVIQVDWTFLQKRYPGNYVSWGSLTDTQQESVRNRHDSLEGFQTMISSPTAAPRMVEPDYAYTKPGPLYVDIHTNVLLGWKIVPGTDLEVLVVQKPVR
ncbi:MAG: hypothetical protein Q8K60_09065 [Parachlamydiaceae bacterium]|nr:hypothetical protein [Parachlamydiaceae bacterium]